MASSSAFIFFALLSGAQADGPVDKVVTMLTDLETGLSNDEKAEQATYDKFACWCETTTQRKATAIDGAKTEMKRLGQDILRQKGTVAIRSDEIDVLNTDIKENKEAQATATTARGKENAAWQAESTETSQAQAAINMAMGVLMKATKSAFLQEESTSQLQATVTNVINTVPTNTLAVLAPEKLAKLRAFTQIRGKAGYAPQSATIQGILSDMYTTMGVDLMDSTALEGRRNRAFESYIAEKAEELKNLNTMLTKKQKEKAEAASMLAEATEAYDDVSKQLEADVAFFDITKTSCTTKTDEWKVRSDLRTEEIDGIKAALTILTSDDAKALFADAIKPGMEKTMFLQVASSNNGPVALAQMKQANLDKIYMKLKQRATKSHSLRFAALAAQVRMTKAGHFDKVLKSIDDLIGVLATEQESDTKKRDSCKDQYQDIAQESKKLEWKIVNNKAKVTKLENLIKTREAEKATTITAIADTVKALADMLKERTDENTAFKTAKKDDEDAVVLLKQARKVMSDFYKNNGVKMGKVQGSVKLAEIPDAAELAEAVELAKPKVTPPQPEAKIDRLVNYKVKGAAASKETKNAMEKHLNSLDKNKDGKLTEKEVSLLQVEQSPLEDPDKAPDASFSNKGKRKGESKGIVSLLTMIIEDLEAEVAHGITNEAAAQTSYEAAKKAAETLKADLEAKKTSLEQAIADRKKDKVDEAADQVTNEDDLQTQVDTKTGIETDCDYMISKYSERRTYREAESESLAEAKEFLSTYFDSSEDASLVQAAPTGISFNHIDEQH